MLCGVPNNAVHGSSEGRSPFLEVGRAAQLGPGNLGLLGRLELLQVGAHAVHQVHAQLLEALRKLLGQAGNLQVQTRWIMAEDCGTAREWRWRVMDWDWARDRA